jgi:hypothetical protein
MAMKSEVLFRLSGGACLLGGCARVLTSIVPSHSVDPLLLEATYELIDVLLLLGLIAIYAKWWSTLGRLGLVAFVVAVASLSMIGGPDSDPFGFSTYRVGAAILSSSLAVLSVVALLRRAMSKWVPLLWIGSWAVGSTTTVLPNPALAFGCAGMLFGASFIAAGVELL